VAADAAWGPAAVGGFEEREVGILEATGGLAGARVLRPVGGDGPTRSTAPPTASPAAAPPEAWAVHAGELRFWFVLAGRLALLRAGAGPEELTAGDSVVVPPGLAHGLAAPSADLELLEVTLPRELPVSTLPSSAAARADRTGGRPAGHADDQPEGAR